MGLFDKFERKLERTVNGAFAKAFRAEVQPVEIASGIRRAMDNKASSVKSGQRPIVPNLFNVELSQTDYDRLTPYGQELSDELVASALEHVDTQRYTSGGPVTVTFSQNTELETGVFQIRPSTARNVDAVAAGQWDGSYVEEEVYHSGGIPMNRQGQQGRGAHVANQRPPEAQPGVHVNRPSPYDEPFHPGQPQDPSTWATDSADQMAIDKASGAYREEHGERLQEAANAPMEDRYGGLAYHPWVGPPPTHHRQAPREERRPQPPSYPQHGQQPYDEGPTADGHSAPPPYEAPQYGEQPPQYGQGAQSGYGGATAYGQQPPQYDAPQPPPQYDAPQYGGPSPHHQPTEAAPPPPPKPPGPPPRPKRKRPWLDIDGERYPLLSAMTVIGRDDEADVILDDPGISRRHSEIRVTYDGPHVVATLRDLGSTNGTYVNGDPVSSARLLDGDRITVGRTTFTIRMGGRR